RVVHLDLSGNYLGDRGLSALLNSPFLSRVRTLRLGRNQITDRGAEAIREVHERLFGQLRVLDLSGNRLTKWGIGVLQVAKEGRPLSVDLSANVQPASGGDVPVAVGDVMPGVLDNMSELRRRVWNPARRD